MNIRPYREKDERALENVLQAVWNGDTGAISNQRFGVDRVVPDSFLRTLVAETESRVVGFASLSQGTYHPHRLYSSVNVHPDFQRQGIGSALFEALLKFPESRRLPIWQTATYSRMEDSVRFLERKGFHRVMETELVTLRPQEMNLEPFRAAEAQAKALGYRVLSLPEIPESKVFEQLADLHYRYYASIHQRNPPGPVFHEERRAIFMGEDLIPEAMFVALDGDRYVGFASVRPGEHSDSFDSAWSTVFDVPESHVPNLMLALKARELEYALAHGIHSLTVEVDDVDTVLVKTFGQFPDLERQVWVTFERNFS